SLKMAQQKQAAAALRAKEGIRANYDPEIDQNNLMLVDATLELNEAMLAGVKASLDTLNSPDPPIKNNNDVKEILQRMKRQRDKQQLKPYLEYMNDSLSLDCAKLRTQREDILSRLTPYLDYQQKMEALANKPVEDAPVASATAKNPKKKEKEAKKPVTDNAVVIRDTALAQPQPTVASAKKAGKEKVKDKGVKATSSIDTVIVYDVSKPVAAKPAKEKHGKPVAAKKDTAERLKPVVASAKEIRDTVIVEDAQKPEPAKDTVTVAKETPKQVEKPAKNTTAAKTDTVTTAKNKEKKPAKTEPVVAKKDTVKKTETVVIDSRPKVDTVAKTVVAKADVKPTVKPSEQTTATATAAGADTIQNIKSQFFLRRAQKAIAEKKSKLAEEYLLKSIELWRDNYDAWMALADEYTKAESPVKALEAYQQCVRIDPMQPKLYYKIGSLHLTSKKKTEALQNFTKAISIDSTFLLAYMSRATVYGDYKQYDAAIADYNKVLSFNKSYYIAYRERGMVKQLSRNFSEAVDDFTRYLIFDDMDPSAYYYRGLAKIGNKELLEGCLDLSKSAEMGYAAAEKAIKKSCE
ncbi:MAG TPA: hypothetical protein VK174_09990, partial [Chitinophagales bacterium]|nr:hypothetical protein [Chitinophagales bacterium]